MVGAGLFAHAAARTGNQPLNDVFLIVSMVLISYWPFNYAYWTYIDAILTRAAIY